MAKARTVAEKVNGYFPLVKFSIADFYPQESNLQLELACCTTHNCSDLFEMFYIVKQYCDVNWTVKI
jgi:hypothetical protein